MRTISVVGIHLLSTAAGLTNTPEGCFLRKTISTCSVVINFRDTSIVELFSFSFKLDKFIHTDQQFTKELLCCWVAAVASHPGQLSLAIHSWVGAMSTSQKGGDGNALRLGSKRQVWFVCGWQVKLCDPLVTGGPYLSALAIRSLYIKRYINSAVLQCCVSEMCGRGHFGVRIRPRRQICVRIHTTHNLIKVAWQKFRAGLNVTNTLTVIYKKKQIFSFLTCKS